MEKEIILTPEELYYMGRFLQAKYIDYAYVSAMDNISRNFALFENETRASLVKSGILMENFDGNVEANQYVVDLLKPIFFGDAETSLDICDVAQENKVNVYKFHFYNEAATMVTGNNGRLIVSKIDQIGIKKIVENILPFNYSAESKVITEPTEKIVTRFIATKSTLAGKKSIVKTYIQADNILYQENEEKTQSLSKEMFISDVYEVVKGV